MINLEDDVIYKITDYLTFNNIIYLSMTNKELYYLFDDLFFTNLAIKMYSNEFWIKALQRPIFSSFPLKTMKHELIRIENFQKILDNLNIDRWTNKDFYNYWQANDNKINNKKIDYVLNLL